MSRWIVIILLVLGAGTGLATGVTAGSAGTVRVTSTEAPVGGQNTVDLELLGVPAPGVGTWTIDVTYDPSVISLDGCTTPLPSSVCSIAFTQDAARFTGASDTGLLGDTVLSTISFTCEAEAETTLIPIIQVFSLADVAGGGPAVPSIEIQPGVVRCAPEDTPVPPITPTPEVAETPAMLPDTGSGNRGDGLASIALVTSVMVLFGAAASLAAVAMRRARP